MAAIQKPAWLDEWCIWVLLGRPNPRPKTFPEKIPTQYLFLPAWINWRLKGGIPNNRPKAVPKDLTAYPWRYDLYAQVKHALALIRQPENTNPPLTANSPIQRLLCMAERPLSVIEKTTHPVAFTADPAYPLEEGIVQQYRDRHFPHLFAWCNPLQIRPGDCEEFARKHKLDGIVGQGESTAEQEATVAAGWRYSMVNMDVMSDAHIKQINDGAMDVLAELYKNTMPWMQPNWRGARVSGNLIACYDGSSEKPWGIPYPVTRYDAEGLYNESTDGVYMPGCTPADYAAIPQ